jgi:hypothetical protein
VLQHGPVAVEIYILFREVAAEKAANKGPEALAFSTRQDDSTTNRLRL